jgi:SAM-dependent methyltransferase
MAFYDHFYSKEAQPTKMGQWIEKKQNKFILSLISSLYKKENISLLEIGVGKGLFADECKKNEHIKYIGIEGNLEQAKILKGKDLEVHNAKVPPVDAGNESFDVVVMDNLLEHMNNVELAISLVKEAWRILKKNGLIIICSPDYLSYKYLFFDVDYTHNFVTTPRRIKQLIGDGKFESIYFTYFSGPFIGNLITFLTSRLMSFIFITKIPYLFGWNNFLKTKIYKIRSSFSRSFLIVGRKVEHGKDGQ